MPGWTGWMRRQLTTGSRCGGLAPALAAIDRSDSGRAMRMAAHPRWRAVVKRTLNVRCHGLPEAWSTVWLYQP